jgi:hypothetical protein
MIYNKLAAAIILSTVVVAPQAYAAKRVAEGKCVALFNRVDRNDDGLLDRRENVQFYLTRITLGESDRVDDFIMQKSTFVWHCQRGMFPMGGA